MKKQIRGVLIALSISIILLSGNRVAAEPVYSSRNNLLENNWTERSSLAVLLVAVTALAMAGTIYYPYRFIREQRLTKQQRALRHEKRMRVQWEGLIEKNQRQIEKNQLLIRERENQLVTIQKRFLEQETIILEKENQLLRLEEEKRSLSDRFFAQTQYKERIYLSVPSCETENYEQLTVFSMKEMPELQEALNALYSDFTNRLQAEYPLLKERDIVICCLIKAGAKTRHLAELIHMTPNAITKKKREILAKMDILTKAEDLELFLRQF